MNPIRYIHDSGLGICLSIQLSEDEEFFYIAGAFLNSADNYARKVGRSICVSRLHSLSANPVERQSEYAFLVPVCAFDKRNGKVDLIGAWKKLHEVNSEVLSTFYDDVDEKYIFRVDIYWDSLFFAIGDLVPEIAESLLT